MEREQTQVGSELNATVRPFRVGYQGMDAIVWATSAAKARYRAALSIADAGWLKRADPSKVSCKRAPEFDHITQFKEGHCYHPNYAPTT